MDRDMVLGLVLIALGAALVTGGVFSALVNYRPKHRS